MIAESTPFGGIYGEDFDQVFGHVPSYQEYKSSLLLSPPGGAKTPTSEEVPIIFDTWTLWFEPVLKLISEYDSIQMWSYINCNWDEQPMWKNIGFGDTRLSSSPTIRQKWMSHVLCNSRFASITTTTNTTATATTATTATESPLALQLDDSDPILDRSSSPDIVATISGQSIFKQSMTSSHTTRLRLQYVDNDNKNNNKNNDEHALGPPVLDESSRGSATVREIFSAMMGLIFMLFVIVASSSVITRRRRRRRWCRDLKRCRSVVDDDSSLPIQNTMVGIGTSYGSLDYDRRVCLTENAHMKM